MPDQDRSRSEKLAYAAAGMDPPPVMPLRKNDPRRVGPYQLVSVLGSGGMGRVYLGRNTTGGGPVAVKVIRPEYAEDPLFRKRFEREVGSLGRVQGAHIVRLLGSGVDEDLVWVATEFVPGPTLAEAIEARGPIDAAAAWRLFADLGRAVEAIWRAGIVHRDLKPSNVILASDGARVIDFGVVQATDGTTITATGQNVGTPAFMSPEQVRGQEVTAASDVFSLASALTFAVTGKAPFGDGTGVDILHRVAFEEPRDKVLAKVAAVDAELAAFIRTCLDKDPERRPSPDMVFRTAIGHQLHAPDGRPPRSTPKGAPLRDMPAALASAPPPGAPAAPEAADTPKVSGAPGKRRKLLVGAAAAAVLVAGGTAAALLQQGGSPSVAAGPGSDTSSAAPDDPAAPPAGSPSAPKTSPSATDQKADQAVDKSPSASPSQKPGSLDLRAAACLAEIVSGGQGGCVKTLQTLLDGYGLHVTIDGRFGASTVAAVRAFQREVGLTADGKVGTRTKKLLYAGTRGPVRTGAVTVTESVNTVDVARCLDVRGASVQVWGCEGAATQKWALYRVPGQGSQYTVVNRGTHLCLDADAGSIGSNGQRVRARNCDGQSAQRWRLGSGHTLVTAAGGSCLDAVAASSGRDGQPVQGWACAGSVNQVWTWS
ncbi:protein kinase domain-containing protein [Streptomyces pseudovenezuelae]|uniref:Serine/threonine protein kinase n=1 Tax=Streptomyces pseudovenezuelae TaxID=67350 RepID=A0ABT6L945_9ACTN|nr:protein kinase [Streptomyces pseudovenezuelae]MDH6212838.1 serine/threonine protein kinase [Streptomyces pseudovenezuelae]